MANVRVSIVPWRRTPADRLPLFFISNQNGVAEFSHLPVGGYHITARGPEELSADMDVKVEPARKGRTGFRMTLGHNMLYGWWLPKEEQSLSMPQFSGIVHDDSGAAVPGASVQLWSVGFETKPPLAVSVSDRAGRVSLSLPDGEYVALFESPGFQSELIRVHIAKDATLARFAVLLHVGVC